MEWPEDFMNKIICGDCLEVMKDMPDECADLIFTDPPYGREFLNCWKTLRIVSEKILKPSHFLVTYTGLMFLPSVLRAMEGDLLFYWPMAIIHQGSSKLLFPRNVINEYKIILLYQKPPFKKLPFVLKDKLTGTGREKSSHPWQQAEFEACKLISQFTAEQEIVLDPFVGGGTTSRACKEMRRNFIGIEINPDYCKIAEERLSQGVL